MTKKVISQKEEWQQHSIAANVFMFLKLACKNHPLVLVFFIIEVILNTVLPLIGMYLPTFALNLAIDDKGIAYTMVSLGGFAGIFVLLQVINGATQQGKYPIQNIMRNLYYQRLYQKALDCDYPIMETSEGRTRYQKAWSCIDNGDDSVTYKMINSAQRLLSGIISFAFLVGILTNLTPYIILFLVVLSAIGFWVDSFPRKFEEKNRDNVADADKKIEYVKKTMSNISAAKDMRLYDLLNLISEKRAWSLELLRTLRQKIQTRYFLAGSLNGIIMIVRDGVAYTYCIWKVLQGDIAIPDFVLYISAITAFSSWLIKFVENITILKYENVRTNELRAFLDYSNTMDPVKPTPISVLADVLEIEFKDVSFRYTDDSTNILTNLSFKIPANEKVALVGVNGAGKTTIVKLLCGFYKATEGCILINGYNIDEFARADLYSLFSAVFQDICIMPFSVIENVSLRVREETDVAHVAACLQRVGLLEAIMNHPQKLDASMTKVVDSDGLILSGGQQQKLLLARALYKNSQIMILDEPTAALDPIAESEVYETFNEMTTNKTVLFISHRLASTRFCDKIIMLENGNIIETGTHTELLAKNGAYAYMYEVQSHYYKDTEELV